jgi:hypothetical protein
LSEWLQQLGSLPLGVLAWFLFVGPAVGFGHALLPKTEARERLDAWLLALAVGVNTVALGALIVLPAADLLGPVGRYVALLGAEVAGWWLLRRAWPRLAPRIGEQRGPGLALGVLVCVLAPFIGPALCYPTGWDDLVYHTVLPLRWLADGTPRVYGDLPYSGFPALGEITFWTLAHIEGIIAPRLLSWTCWIATVLMLCSLLRKTLRPWVAVALSLAYALSRTQLMLAANTYVEALIALNLAAMCLLMDETRDGDQVAGQQYQRYLILIGVLTGGAVAVKLTGAMIALIPAAWLLIRTPGGERPTRTRDAVVVVATAVAMAGPFFIRPWLATGNPLYPYFDSLFCQDQARQAASQFHHAMGAAKFGLPGPLSIVSAPFLLAFDYEVYDGAFGWQWVIVLAVLALGFRAGRRCALTRCTVIGALGMYTFWQATAQQARFLVPAVLAIHIAVGPAVAALKRPVQNAMALALVAASLACLPFERSGYYTYSWLTALGRVSLADYVHTGTDESYLPAADAILNTCSSSDHVLLLFEQRSLYIPRPCTIGTPFFQADMFGRAADLQTPEAVLGALLAADVSHVLLALNSGGPDQIPAYVEKMRPLAQSVGRLIADGRLQTAWESESHLLCSVVRTANELPPNVRNARPPPPTPFPRAEPDTE